MDRNNSNRSTGALTNGRSTTPNALQTEISPRTNNNNNNNNSSTHNNNKHHSPGAGVESSAGAYGDQKSAAQQRLNYGADGSGQRIKREPVIKSEYGDYGNNNNINHNSDNSNSALGNGESGGAVLKEQDITSTGAAEIISSSSHDQTQTISSSLENTLTTSACTKAVEAVPVALLPNATPTATPVTSAGGLVGANTNNNIHTNIQTDQTQSNTATHSDTKGMNINSGNLWRAFVVFW